MHSTRSVDRAYTLVAEVVAGTPCARGQVVVRTRLQPEHPKARLYVGRKRGPTVVVDLPVIGDGNPEGSEAHIPVIAKVGREVVAETQLDLPLPPCAGRVVATARPVGPTTVRVRAALLDGGQPDVGPLFRYDFGQGDVKVTRDRDVTFDYGAEAEGQTYIISVTAGPTGETSSSATAPSAGKSPPAGLVGYAVVAFPRLDALRELEATIERRQQEQNELADRLRWDNR
ncbi:MAG: hypothetical protein AAGN82_22380 [Myxococcota bacterium]